MVVSEEELQKMAMQMNYYQNQAEELQSQIRALNALIQENDLVKETLKNLGGQSDSLFAVGSGVFVKAKASSGKVLVEAGAKVFVEKTPEEAISILEKRRNQLVSTLSQMQSVFQELNDRMMALNHQAEQMQKERGGG